VTGNQKQPVDPPLAGVRVLDLADERGIYGSKLLADLGASTIRLESSHDDGLRKRGPLNKNGESLWYSYYASNRVVIEIDTESDHGITQLKKLVSKADIIIDTGIVNSITSTEFNLNDLNSKVVHVDVSSFGQNGPWKDFLAPDLIAGALGGSVAATGDINTTPIKLFGDQSFLVSGTYAAIAALTGLYDSYETGLGGRIDIPVHETIASTLEHVLMFALYPGFFPWADGKVLPRRGSLHWGNAYEVVPAIGGSIMVTPTPNVEKQIAWLVEEQVEEDLLDERYTALEHRQEFVKRIMTVLRKWVATKDAESFFHEAQSRHYPFGLVMKPNEVANNPHLKERNWWKEYPTENSVAKGPGDPYKFSRSVLNKPAKQITFTSLSENILNTIGWV
jgi:benzylsuccinate CoA-transferase BbsE subunit/naphthyl-2-methylsuccinate CoA transferase subunit